MFSGNNCCTLSIARKDSMAVTTHDKKRFYCCCYDWNVLQHLSKAKNLDNQVFEKADRGDIEGALIATDALLSLHELHEEPIERTSYDRFQLHIILQGGIGSETIR